MPERKPPLDPAKACATNHAQSALTHLLTRLEIEAGKSGGHLGMDQIRATANRFMTEEWPTFALSFQRTFDNCTQMRDERKWSGVRKQPFDRILMKKFAHLFPARSGDDGDRGILSRRIVPGITLAITKMIGPTLYDQCQRKTRAIMDRYPLPGNDGGCNWDGVYDDSETIMLTNDVLMAVAHYFADFHKRKNWFVELINSHLAEDKTQEFWALTDHAFAELMRALFDDLAKRKESEIRARYGDHSAHALRGFLAELERLA